MPQLFHSAVITNAGIQLLLKAQAGEAKIEFTKLKTGNGSYAEEEKEASVLQEMTDLKSVKNSYCFSDVKIHSDHCVKVTSLITNYDSVARKTLISEGYYINEIGLYAKEKDVKNGEEVLYSIAVTSGENGDFMPPYNGLSPVEIIQEYYATVSNSAEVVIQGNAGAAALAEDLWEADAKIESLEQAVDEIQRKTDQFTEKEAGYLSGAASSIQNQIDELKEAAGKEDGGAIEGCAVLWSGILYDNISDAEFYAPKKYWHNDNLTLMIDCVRYGDSGMPTPYSKTVLITLTRPHKIYVSEENVVKLNEYSASLYYDRGVTKGSAYEQFSTNTGCCNDIIDISALAESLTTNDYARVSVHKLDSSRYVITDIYAVIPQMQEE